MKLEIIYESDEGINPRFIAEVVNDALLGLRSPISQFSELEVDGEFYTIKIKKILHTCFGCDELFDTLTVVGHHPLCEKCVERTPCYNCAKRWDYDDMHSLPHGAYCQDCYLDIYG